MSSTSSAAYTAPQTAKPASSSEALSAHPVKRLPTPQRSPKLWDRWELPTVALAAILYAAWATLIWWHALIPGALLFLLGGYVAQLHFSLQHEFNPSTIAPHMFQVKP